jgi:DNA mismatch repair protein MutS
MSDEPDPARRAVAPDGLRSVLFDGDQAAAEVRDVAPPTYFGDLNLDQVVTELAYRRDAYDLPPFFHAALTDLDAIEYRQEVFADLEQAEVRALADAFARRRLVARNRSEQRSLGDDDGDFAHHHRTREFLNAVVGYCAAVTDLVDGLRATEVQSRALIGLRDHLGRYVAGASFGQLAREAGELEAELDAIRYSFLVKGLRITVGPYEERPDYSAEVAATFDRFRQTDRGAETDGFREWDTFVALGLLDLVARNHPALFTRLDEFRARHWDYLHPTVERLDRELQFYLAYLEYIAPLRDAGLPFERPTISTEDRSAQALDTFDLALAYQRGSAASAVVRNDVRLQDGERMLVITGPNNGGKTTLARAIGQLHHLARLGCPVPGRDVRLHLSDRIVTRFERREDIATLSGKLQDELNRLREALRDATRDTVFIFNEMFSSTTAQDALWLSRQILGRVAELGAVCVCVTFLDELTTFDERTVSMVSTVDPADPAVRTFRVVRRAADGRAYARAVAERHGLTYAQLRARGD